MRTDVINYDEVIIREARTWTELIRTLLGHRGNQHILNEFSLHSKCKEPPLEP